MDKILTVVIPTYNMEKYLRKCLDSLIIDDKDLFDKLEVLIVNDGSKDSSSAIAHEYQDNYPNVFRVIDKENGGHGSCCNVGLREAQGKYIHFLDSDDWFDKDFSTYLERISKLDVDVILTKRVDEYAEIGLSKVHHHDAEYDKLYNIEDFDYTKIAHTLFSIHESTFSVEMIRKNRIVFIEHCSYDDTILRIAPFPSIKQFYMMDIVLYHYLLGRPGQSMAPNVYRKKLGQLEMNVFQLLDYVANMNTDGLPRNVKKYIQYVFVVHANLILRDYIRTKAPDRKQDVLRCYNKLCQYKYRMWMEGSEFFKELSNNHSSCSLYSRFLYSDILTILRKVYHYIRCKRPKVF